MRIFAVFSMADDPCLSKIDSMMFSEQTLLEIFISDIRSKDAFQDQNGEFKDIGEWEGVYLRSDGSMRQVSWSNFKQAFFADGGSLRFEFLPQKVEKLDAAWNYLWGTLQLSSLPKSLETISLSHNCLQGTLDFQCSPQKVSMIFLDYNEFSGKVDLTCLPEYLEYLFLSKNELSGSIDVEKLPESMQELLLDHNQFSGTVSFKCLPDMRVLNLTHNELNGELDLLHLPDSMEEIGLQENKFSGTAQIRSDMPSITLLFIHDNDIEAVMDEKGDVIGKAGSERGEIEWGDTIPEELSVALGALV